MEGKGLALAWQNLIEPHLGNGWLVGLPQFTVTTGKGYYLVFAKNHPEAAALRAWIESTR